MSYSGIKKTNSLIKTNYGVFFPLFLTNGHSVVTSDFIENLLRGLLRVPASFTFASKAQYHPQRHLSPCQHLLLHLRFRTSQQQRLSLQKQLWQLQKLKQHQRSKMRRWPQLLQHLRRQRMRCQKCGTSLPRAMAGSLWAARKHPRPLKQMLSLQRKPSWRQ